MFGSVTTERQVKSVRDSGNKATNNPSFSLAVICCYSTVYSRTAFTEL